MGSTPTWCRINAAGIDWSGVSCNLQVTDGCLEVASSPCPSPGRAESCAMVGLAPFIPRMCKEQLLSLAWASL
jgi:hypothetical protein